MADLSDEEHVEALRENISRSPQLISFQTVSWNCGDPFCGNVHLTHYGEDGRIIAHAVLSDENIEQILEIQRHLRAQNPGRGPKDH